MPKNLIFADSEKVKASIMESQKKEIADLYNKWADEISERANYYSHKSNASAPLSERYYRELQKQLRETSHQVSNEVHGLIKNNMYVISDAVVADNVKWLQQFGFSTDGLNAAFSYVPDDVVRKLITGNVYDSGWSLSKRIWCDNEDTLKDIYKVMAKGIAEQKPIYQIAKDLESYVRPSARLPWNTAGADGVKIYKKQVDYAAQRLARTLVQHTYQQSFVETTKDNPFVMHYIWHSNGSRVCPICIDRDGQVYEKDNLPLDHPNGMCVMEPAVDPDMNQKLVDWFNSPDGTFPEIDDFAGNFGYEASKTGTVKDFIDKYGTSTKSPSAWFNSLTQVQKAEAKALKEQSGLTWNKWYEQNIYAGDGTNLGGKKVAVFTKEQEKYLKPYGFSPSNMPTSFDDWSHKVSTAQIEEILKSMGTSYYSDPHPYQKLMQYYEANLTKTTTATVKKEATKKVAKQATSSGTFSASEWADILRQQNLRKMEGWTDDWLKIVTSTQSDAVTHYTGHHYSDMNEYLRGISSSIGRTDKAAIRDAQAALAQASLPEEVVVRRGASYNMLRDLGVDYSDKSNVIGMIVEDKGFMSTSPDPNGGFSGSIEYVVRVPQGSQAMYVAPISNFRSERELLINCGGKYMVEEVEYNSYNEPKKIYMTLVNLQNK